MGNGVLDGTIMNMDYGIDFNLDLGLLTSWQYSDQSYQVNYRQNPNSNNNHAGCVFDADSDGICDTQDHCRDLNACNYMAPENNWCFTDYDQDGICDNLDGCFETGMMGCNHSDPNATYCRGIYAPYPDNNPLTFDEHFDGDCNYSYETSYCTDIAACNYANVNYETCQYPNSGFDCFGNCLSTTCIGMEYQGGTVVYIFQPGEIGFVPGETHGLIMANQDLPNLYQWGCNGVDLSGVSGNGFQNTMDIVQECPEISAGSACSELFLNGYDDWFLPSLAEMLHIFENNISFSDGLFWTSSEVSTISAYVVISPGPGIDSSELLGIEKSGTALVRPFRIF